MSKHLNALIPENAAWLTETFARNRARFGGWRMEAEGDGSGGDAGTGGDAGAGDKGKGKADGDATFTQADVDAAVEKVAAKIRADERRKVSEKFADYDDLKKKAGATATAEEQIASLQKEVQATRLEALKRRVQAAHGISDEDADLFLTGADEDALTAQAKRLAERESERKKQGNHVSREGRNPAAKANDERETVRSLFGRSG